MIRLGSGNARRGPWGRRRSFTLAELMVVIVIIAVLTTTTLFALFGVMDDAKEARTESQITKLNEMIMARWEAYRVRPVPVKVAAAASPTVAAQVRLAGLRELMRMELPDRKTDLIDPAGLLVRPGTATPLEVSLWRTYRRQADAMVKAKHGATADWRLDTTWTPQLQGAECLYLIVSVMRDGDSNGLDFFKESEIADTDDDGMPEIIDGWGRPIEFLRWAPGFYAHPGSDGVWGTANGGPSGNGDDDDNGTPNDISERGWPGSDDELLTDIQNRDAASSPDPFDPLRVDPRWSDSDPTNDPFALYPLIFSAGRDQIYDIVVDYDTDTSNGTFDHFRYVATTLNCTPTPLPNDPYHVSCPPSAPIMMGLPVDVSGGVGGGGDGVLNCIDNITNHTLGTN